MSSYEPSCDFGDEVFLHISVTLRHNPSCLLSNRSPDSNVNIPTKHRCCSAKNQVHTGIFLFPGNVKIVVSLPFAGPLGNSRQERYIKGDLNVQYEKEKHEYLIYSIFHLVAAVCGAIR